MPENILKTTLVADSKQLRQELTKAERSLQAFGDKAKSIGKTLSLTVTAPIVAAGGYAIKMASDFQESLNKVDVAFKNSSSEVKKFAKTTLEGFGIAEGTALDMAALFGDMSTSMGLSTKEASKMSTALVGLAGDLSSFKNMNIEEVTTALNGVFTGETESLKRLGIVMTEANLAQFALSQGIKGNIKDFTQAEKVQLRYQYVMAMTTNAHGDFIRTQGGSANQMRIFQESLKELGVLFGDVLLPEFTKIIKKVNQWLKKLKEMTPEQKEMAIKLAAIAAAIGPVLVGLGSLAGSVSKISVAFRTVNGLVGGAKGFTSLISKIPPAAGLAVGAITGLVWAFDELTDKMAPNLTLWEKTKAFFAGGGFAPGGAGIVSGLTNMAAADITKQQQTKDPGLYGMDLLSFGQTGGTSTGGGGGTTVTELFTDAQLAEQEKLAGQFEDLFSGVGTDINYVAAESAAKIDEFGTAISNLYNSEPLEEKLSAWSSAMDQFNESANNLVAQGLGGMLEGIGSLLGQAAAGAKVGIDDLMNVVLGGIGDMAIQLGKLAIQTGIAMKAIKMSFKNPATAIAAGVALVALGSFVKGAAANILSGGGDRGKNSIPAFASGGIVSGPTIGLMGEYPGAKTNPEVIAPLDKLQNMLGNKGGNVNVSGEFRIKGQDLVVAVQRANRERDRIK